MVPLQSRKTFANQIEEKTVLDSFETPNTQSIAVRAYELWLERGCPHGSPEADWYRAEHELHVAS